MPQQSGNWFTGYQGQATYRPEGYAFKTPSFYRDPKNQIADIQDRGEQDWMLQEMRNRAFGGQSTGPSVAELQLGQGMRQRQNAAMSLLGGGGLNPAAARRQALAAQEGAMGDFNEQAAVLRAQEEAQRRGEQLQAQGMYGQLLSGVRGQNQAISEADRQALMELERLRGAQSLGLNQLMTQQEIANAGNLTSAGLMAPLLGGLSTFGGMALGGYLGRG